MTDERELEKKRLENLGSYAVKAELFVVSITFSLLALSVQFPVQSDLILAIRLQVLGWVLLAAAGLAGIATLKAVSKEYRMEMVLLSYKMEAKEGKKEAKLIASLSVPSVEDSILRYRGRYLDWIEPTQRWALVFGLLLLVAARISAIWV